ncbi:hypothetical protein [Maribacter aurantiacus]|uniref:hypothetical protein n=1 Tax=Maribacter aurantiacus TaxID=1882343 RepID=UPI001F007BE8|nr:hypothetical protein [Maribacter aurantiacus]
MKENKVLELLQRSQEEGLYLDLLQQLQKDFLLANCNIKLEVAISFQNLSVLVKEKLYVLLMERFDEYLNLLYVIDVPEHELRQIDAMDAVEVAEQVSFFVLERELQKVRSKRRYGN